MDDPDIVARLRALTNYPSSATRQAADEIERLRACVDAFMSATSKGKGWGTYQRMDSPDLYAEVKEARAMAVAVEQGEPS